MPCYLNSPTSLVWDTSGALYGLGDHDHDHALRNGATPVLVDGSLDARAVTAADAGEYIGVAALGVAVTGTHVQALHDVADLTDRVILLGSTLTLPAATPSIRAAGLTRQRPKGR